MCVGVSECGGVGVLELTPTPDTPTLPHAFHLISTLFPVALLL